MDGMLAILVLVIVALAALVAYLWRGQAFTVRPFPRDLNAMDDEDWAFAKRRVAGLIVLAVIVVLVGFVVSKLV